MINDILSRLKRVSDGRTVTNIITTKKAEHGTYDRLAKYGVAKYAAGFAVYGSSQYGYSTYNNKPDDTTANYGLSGYGELRYQ